MRHTFVTTLRCGLELEVSSGLISRIVLRLEVVDTEWPDRGDLGNVFTGVRPVEVRRVAQLNNNGAWRANPIHSDCRW